MRFIAGLGNPGRRYRKTRHNVGFMLIDRLAEEGGCGFTSFSSVAKVGRARLEGETVLLVKPQTFMNLSGSAVREVVRYFQLDTGSSLVVYDEVALPLGSIRLRASGSSGGHKGMQSIIDHLGTFEVPRLRIGIAGKDTVSDLSDYVLDEFSRKEAAALSEVLEHCERAVAVYLREGIDRAMAQFN